MNTTARKKLGEAGDVMDTAKLVATCTAAATAALLASTATDRVCEVQHMYVIWFAKGVITLHFAFFQLFLYKILKEVFILISDYSFFLEPS